MPDLYIAPPEQTKWLTLSSFFFTLPAIYGFMNQLHSHSVLLALTSLISANYWRKATYSWRRNMDLVFSKIAFGVFFYEKIVHVRAVPHLVAGGSGLVLLTYCYYFSGKYFDEKKDVWYKYYFAFHTLLTFEQFLVLYTMAEHRRLK